MNPNLPPLKFVGNALLQFPYHAFVIINTLTLQLKFINQNFKMVQKFSRNVAFGFKLARKNNASSLSWLFFKTFMGSGVLQFWSIFNDEIILNGVAKSQIYKYKIGVAIGLVKEKIFPINNHRTLKICILKYVWTF